MAKKQFDDKLAAIEQLRRSDDLAGAEKELRKALGDRNNYVVSKAAQSAGQLSLRSLAPELIAAFDRFLKEPVKTDPQCWAKNALVLALVELGHTDPAIFLRGLRHIQMEPVWGGQQDTAGTLRGRCAHALIDCRSLDDHEILSLLVELLVDAEKTVRAEAARAIGRLERKESGLLLRLRALVGDEESEVIGACLTAVLAAEGPEAIEFVARFLDSPGDVAGEAALALGSLHDERALSPLKERLERRCDPDLTEVIFTAMALMRLDPAYDYVLGLIRADAQRAALALQALGRATVNEEMRGKIAQAVEQSGSERLSELYGKEFPD